MRETSEQALGEVALEGLLAVLGEDGENSLLYLGLVCVCVISLWLANNFHNSTIQSE
jgi:hypothetical protein